MVSTKSRSPKTAHFPFLPTTSQKQWLWCRAEMFDKKLKEFSKGTLSINQYPGAQLGTEADHAEGADG
jgi:TRAP-type C4-dicarboxylate transport system substrate-binding protein